MCSCRLAGHAAILPPCGVAGSGTRSAAALIAAVALVVVAAALWLLVITHSWASECPESGALPTGLDKAISLWPPGADCYAEPLRQGESNRLVIYEAAPFLKWIVLGLALTAVMTVIAGLAASISVLRSRGVES
jgi:hypothetical protein